MTPLIQVRHPSTGVFNSCAQALSATLSSTTDVNQVNSELTNVCCIGNSCLYTLTANCLVSYFETDVNNNVCTIFGQAFPFHVHK